MATSTIMGVLPGTIVLHERLSPLVAVASAPTLVGSGASVLALTRGPLGLWAALTGTQVLFIAGLGALWHRETLGRRRALCFVAAAIAVAALALADTP